jgi:hypothetical protein
VANRLRKETAKELLAHALENQQTISTSKLKKIMAALDYEGLERKVDGQRKTLATLQERVVSQRKLLGGLQSEKSDRMAKASNS